MAGHSQFKNIMHRKGAQDAKRAKLFTKLLREITVACSVAGPDPEANPRLRTAVQVARQSNVPKDNIERAIARAVEGGEGEGYESLRYEGFGPGQIPLILEILTDNRNRTASEIRYLFNKNGGRMGETNSVSFLFDHVGCILYPSTHPDLSLRAIDLGAVDIEEDADNCTVFCPREDFFAVKESLEKEFGEALAAQLIWRAHTPAVDLAPEDKEGLLHLINVLSDHDDVQAVWSSYTEEEH